LALVFWKEDALEEAWWGSEAWQLTNIKHFDASNDNAVQQLKWWDNSETDFPMVQ
jgi:hypothetical protein